MDPQGFNDNSRLRASDADRDKAAAVINNALAEGRLTAEEHSDRLDAIYAAKTHAELVPLLDDLPGQQAAARPAPPGDGREAARRGGRIVAILSGATRKGTWHPDPVLTVVAVLGGVEVTVPPEMRVVDNGIAILGGREITGNPDEAGSPDAPVLRIEGTCVLGGIEVRRKARKTAQRGRGKGINVSIESGGFPAIRVRPADRDD